MFSQSVMKCDFLSVSIVDPPEKSDTGYETSSATTPSTPNSSASPVSEGSPTSSLIRGSYQVVVFSLFLSYLPECRQRLRCCVRAHELLCVHGLLLVVTPDSSHQNRHVAMMRSWKTSIEAIGFHRYRYTKQTHLHCMAFRKTSAHTRTLDSLDQSLWDGLYIPQDRPVARATGAVASSSTTDELAVSENTAELLHELPFSESQLEELN